MLFTDAVEMALPLLASGVAVAAASWKWLLAGRRKPNENVKKSVTINLDGGASITVDGSKFSSKDIAEIVEKIRDVQTKHPLQDL